MESAAKGTVELTIYDRVAPDVLVNRPTFVTLSYVSPEVPVVCKAVLKITLVSEPDGIDWVVLFCLDKRAGCDTGPIGPVKPVCPVAPVLVAEPGTP